MKYDPTQYQGPVQILDGHPVPYSATCQRRRKDDGQLESVRAIHFLGDIADWLAAHRPGQQLLRTEGAYFFYGPPRPDAGQSQ